MFLALASLLLLAVIAYQNYAYPPLRNLTISDGLYTEVPTFWALDAAYVVLATALYLAFKDVSLGSQVLSGLAGAALMVTAISNSASKLVDRVTGGLHNKIHTDATIVMFLSVLLLEGINNHGWLTWLTVGSVVVPACVGLVMTELKTKLLGGPVAEKLAVLGLCSWLIAWSL
jgi:hypothetical protein